MNQLEKAMIFAVQAHEGAYRKTGNVPFILHPMEVVCVASTLTDDLDVLAACVLHDVVEDTDVTIEEVTENFGDRVGYLVACETEDKRHDQNARDTWMIRKMESLEVLKNTKDMDVKIMWLADKLANMRSFYRLHQQEGDQLWLRFHESDPKKQEWYYRSAQENLTELKDTAAYEEYNHLMNEVFGRRTTDGKRND